MLRAFVEIKYPLNDVAILFDTVQRIDVALPPRQPCHLLTISGEQTKPPPKQYPKKRHL